MATYNIGFILEQALGHVTHSKNLLATVPQDQEVKPHWALIPFEASGMAATIPVYRSNWTVRAGLRARQLVANMVRRTTIDALFFHTQVPAVLAQGWMRRFPSIVSLDATPMQYDALGDFYGHQRGPSWLESVKWRLNRDCYAAARKIVTWAEWTKRGLVNDYQVPADKVTVIPPGVNVRDWRRPLALRAHNKPVKILFVGANLERKGGSLLLAAFRELRSLGIELHLVTKDEVGPEPGLFVYNDMEPNSQPLKDLYHSCDVFALPTLGDCLPMALSEAGAAGLAIISTDVAAIPEIVRHGETGLIMPAGDKAALISAIKALNDNAQYRVALASAAVAHVSRCYDGEANAERLLNMLKIEAEAARH